jgi:hypothetical protein
MMVRNTETGERGVVVNDFPGMLRVCDHTEIPVVYEGSSGFFGTDYQKLEYIGFEEAVPDLQRCGAGKGEECCKFLTAGPGGLVCERFGQFRNTLLFKNDMTAKREPVELFPACQIF